jgi:hypothetical protein
MADIMDDDTSEPQSLNVFRGEERDWTQQYAAIGEFVVEFEWICLHIRHTISMVLQFQGLNNWKLGEIILNQPSFSADPLASTLSSIIGEILSANVDVIGKMNEFRSGFQKLSRVRNDLLHGFWLIGPDVVEVTDHDTPTEIHGERRTPNKRGANVKTVLTIAEIKEHINEAKRLKQLSKALMSAVIIAMYKLESEAGAERLNDERSES